VPTQRIVRHLGTPIKDCVDDRPVHGIDSLYASLVLGRVLAGSELQPQRSRSDGTITVVVVLEAAVATGADFDRAGVLALIVKASPAKGMQSLSANPPERRVG
jgi:hypothetical protein